MDDKFILETMAEKLGRRKARWERELEKAEQASHIEGVEAVTTDLLGKVRSARELRDERIAGLQKLESLFDSIAIGDYEKALEQMHKHFPIQGMVYSLIQSDLRKGDLKYAQARLDSFPGVKF